MTSNALKSAILLDAMAVIVPDFDNEAESLKGEHRNFTIYCAYHPLGCCGGPGSSEIWVLDAARHLEKYRGEPPSCAGALRCMQVADGNEDRGMSWTSDACTSVDKDGDELITIFGSRRHDQIDVSQDCGTYAVLGGTGKFKGFSAIGSYVLAGAEAPDSEFAATFALEVMRKKRRS